MVHRQGMPGLQVHACCMWECVMQSARQAVHAWEASLPGACSPGRQSRSCRSAWHCPAARSSRSRLLCACTRMRCAPAKQQQPNVCSALHACESWCGWESRGRAPSCCIGQPCRAQRCWPATAALRVRHSRLQVAIKALFQAQVAGSQQRSVPRGVEKGRCKKRTHQVALICHSPDDDIVAV